MSIQLLPSHRNPFEQEFKGKGRLIVFEGMDGTGKGTQAKLFLDFLNSRGYACGFFTFPDYLSPVGQKIGALLNDPQTQLSAYEKGSLFAEDRKQKQEQIHQALDEGHIVVCDRYYLSNCFNWVSEVAEKRELLQEDLERLDIDTNRMPLPHLTFILDLPVEISSQKVLEKPQRDYTDKLQDANESDMALQRRVRDFLLGLRKVNPWAYQVIDCTSPNARGYARQRDIDAIACEIQRKFLAYQMLTGHL